MNTQMTTNKTVLRTKTAVKAGIRFLNHNQAVPPGLRTGVTAGGCGNNHNQAAVLRTKTAVKAGMRFLNHNQPAVLRTKTAVKAGGGGPNHNQSTVLLAR